MRRHELRGDTILGVQKSLIIGAVEIDGRIDGIGVHAAECNRKIAPENRRVAFDQGLIVIAGKLLGPGVLAYIELMA